MNIKNVSRLAVCAAVLALAAASSIAAAAAAEGTSCVVRAAGPQGSKVGHVNADGKCVTQAEPKVKEDDGLQASAQCRDLSFSYNKRRDSACAKHGGVLEWLAQQ